MKSLRFTSSGENCDLVLHIYKDEDYNQKTREYNLVAIHTAKNGTFVDDTEDIFVTDGSLERELEQNLGAHSTSSTK